MYADELILTGVPSEHTASSVAAAIALLSYGSFVAVLGVESRDGFPQGIKLLLKATGICLDCICVPSLHICHQPVDVSLHCLHQNSIPQLPDSCTQQLAQLQGRLWKHEPSLSDLHEVRPDLPSQCLLHG